ncbi:DUF4157 domain-containing protein [Acidobacteria bacterium AB60]|nr:DUF4157 domain-containing protein [Acidobacteria bacterium AB60]
MSPTTGDMRRVPSAKGRETRDERRETRGEGEGLDLLATRTRNSQLGWKCGRMQTLPPLPRRYRLKSVPIAKKTAGQGLNSAKTGQELRPSDSGRAADPARSFSSPIPRSWDFRGVPVHPRGGGPLRAGPEGLEEEARRVSQGVLQAGEPHPLVREGLAQARVHSGPGAARLAEQEKALAFTVGRDIWFGAGQYRPETAIGQQLIAHEAVHVAQQMRSGQAMLQRQPTGTQMPPLQVQGTLNPVERAVPHLDRLKGAGVTPETVEMEHDAGEVERNTVDPTTPLPFTPNGWDGTTILNRLGQYDRIAGTDSDSLRCVQAVGMAARVPDGPSAVSSYLGAMILQGMTTGNFDQRKRTAMDVLKYIQSRIEMKHATYGDLSWAQEALHDLFYDDVSGTPLADIPGQVAPGFDFTKNMQPMDVWCDNPQQVMAAANQLQNGEQLLVDEWTVHLNWAFDDLEAQGIHVREGQSATVNSDGRQARITRINEGQRPPHTALNFARDRRMGHQLLIVKDAATGALRLYEPETTATGHHFDGLAADGSNLAEYFQDQPRFGIYHYIQIIGKLTAGLTASLAR